jgi:hypothetical protein
MRRWLLGALAAVLLPIPASAANTTFPQVSEPPYFVCKITTTTATTCVVPGQNGSNGGASNFPTNNAAVLVGYANNSATAQTATVTCYDSLTASGYQVTVIPALAVGQIGAFPLPGVPLSVGLTCIASAAITGDSVEVFFR